MLVVQDFTVLTLGSMMAATSWGSLNSFTSFVFTWYDIDTVWCQNLNHGRSYPELFAERQHTILIQRVISIKCPSRTRYTNSATYIIDCVLIISLALLLKAFIRVEHYLLLWLSKARYELISRDREAGVWGRALRRYCSCWVVGLQREERLQPING